MEREIKRLIRALAVASSLLCAHSVDAAREFGARKTFTVTRTNAAPVIDGLLDDPVWRDAVVVSDFHQNTPHYRADPTESTLVRVLYDANHLYISAHLLDSAPERINAKQLIQGRAISSDDRFFVALDTFNSNRNDYLFEVNANGIRREVLRESNSRSIENWTAIWHAATTRNGDGWSAEIAIPFKSISFAPESDIWGINFGRWIIRKQEFNLWTSNERLWWAAESGEMNGISEIHQGIGLDIVPAVNLRQVRHITAGSTEQTFDPSVDVFYRMTPSLSATFTVNTDFSSADADERQIALDRFSLFFPEKRDFFLQDAGIFEFGNISTNGRPFFSRRIGLSSIGRPIGIDAGGKLTGRVGRFSLGALGIRQEAHGDVDASDLFVGRFAANVLSESQLGVIMTHGNPISNDSNTLIGTDFIYRDSNGPFGQIMSGHAWFQRSETPDVDFGNNAFGGGIEFPNDRFQVRVAASEIQENFRPALGFVNRSGIRRYEALLRNRIRPDSGSWREVDSMVDAVLVSDLDGELLSQLTRLTPVSIRLHSGDIFSVDWERIRERVQMPFSLFGSLTIPVGDYTFDRYRADLSTGAQRPVSLQLSIQGGGFFTGDRRERSIEVQWRQSRHFFLGIGFTENVVQLPSGDFTAHLGNLRTDVAFNSSWSWSSLLQYDNVADVAAINSRLRFEPESGRELLFVLNHGISTSPEYKFDSLNNELVVRLSYTFRY